MLFFSKVDKHLRKKDIYIMNRESLLDHFYVHSFYDIYTLALFIWPGLFES